MRTARLFFLFSLTLPALADPLFESIQLVQAGGVNLTVNGYSIPELADWDGDGRPDLLVGEGGGAFSQSKVRLYLNQGQPGAPLFGAWSYLQAAGAEISQPSISCMGVCPRVADWNADGLPDLLLGRADGTVVLYLNDGAPGTPHLVAGVSVLAGPAGQQLPLDVGNRATPVWVDWNADGRPDLLCGAMDGKAWLALNQGAPGAPLLASPVALLNSGGTALVIPSGRSCLVPLDPNGDGVWDLLAGNTDGRLLDYHNLGGPGGEAFSGPLDLLCGGAPVDLPSTLRCRPAACDWNGDGQTDLLIGYGDGLVRLALAPTPPPPAAPDPLTIQALDGTLRLSWPPGASMDSYRIYQSIDGATWSLAGETGDTQWLVPVPPDGMARYRVTCVR